MELLHCPFCGRINEVTWYIDLRKVSCGICEIYIPVDIWNNRSNKWISVETLPKEDGYYFVLGKRGTMAFAMYIEESKQFTIVGDITHYMPIPPFPVGFLPKESK